MGGKCSVTDLQHLTWGDILKMNALMDMEEDFQSAFRTYMNPERKG